MKVTFGSHSLEITPCGDYYCATFEGQELRIDVLRAENGRMDLLIDDQRVVAHVSSDLARRWVTISGQTVMLTKTSGAKTGVRHEHAGGLTAPMPGQVRDVSVSAGEAVRAGQTLVVLEAMKMEIRIQALRDGRVKAVHVAPGQTVEREQILIEMEAA